MKKYFFLMTAAACFLCGCSFWPQPPTLSVGPAENITIDGLLKEKCWSKAPEYSLTSARSQMKNLHPDLREKYGRKPAGPGKVRLVADSKYLYVGAVLIDDDIVSLGTCDQQSHCGSGDVFEIFLKPENANHYWELHITPTGYCAVIFYPSRGYHFLSKIVMPEVRPLKKIQYKSVITGTLNKPGDFDRLWTLEAAIPLDELAAKGIPFDSDHPWRILIGRYNYSCHQKICELSSFPQLERFNFHAHEEYGFIKIEKPESKFVNKHKTFKN